MLWYYTRGLLDESEFLSGLQEKVLLAQESTGWEFVVIGILDINFYIRLASLGLPLGILPRGETICAHTVTQPPGSVFLLPNMMEDWRFKESPYAEAGGLRSYAGAPLRLQNESGECVAIGSLCVAASTPQEPLNKLQQQTLARLADWVVSDIVHCARARRQRDRRQMSEHIFKAQREAETAVSEEPVARILQATYPEATITVQPCKSGYVHVDNNDAIPLADLADGVWEDTAFLDDFIANYNSQELPSTKVVRVLAAPCEFISGPSLLVVASKDFRLVFDDIDTWFIQTCANIASQIWHRRLLTEVMATKEKFLRGFSHQLRTPIHGILGSVELLAEELMLRTLPSADASTKSVSSTAYLDNIRSAGQDLITIVNSMITLNRWADIAIAERHYANHTTFELETEIMNHMIKATTGDWRYGSSVFFFHDLPPNCPKFRVDLSLLRDSLLPLVINAVQNTPDGVVAVTLSLKPEFKELIVDIEDTGCGIHPENQQRVFEAYEKATAHSVGAGLGLTLASKFASLLYGSVALISSEVGCGSHFRATFREVDCHATDLPPQILPQTLKRLPSTYSIKRSETNSNSLCDYFCRYLISEGFLLSENADDACCVILDFMSESEQLEQSRDSSPSTTGETDASDRLSECVVESPVSDMSSFLLRNFDTEQAISAKYGPIHLMPFPSTVSKPTALLVDDNVINLRVMQMYCVKRGLPFHLATDGIEAVQIFSKQQSLVATGEGTGIQLILMDLQMPRCDGFEATRQIRRLEYENKWVNSIVFIVTGQDSPADRDTAEEIGAVCYFVKPMAIKGLDRGVKKFFPKFQTG
ncbi:hypothetical protein NQ176_g9873 [Zarea fungicola]|uniref:Uncharacterized protein n=1 Tax=Zarea fungicola TaxID=93591 RepID=A0ACC1MJ34_9HYPO|nr:hypothetical protein NQ176_g9873 [Lecanicillium fungicola]